MVAWILGLPLYMLGSEKSGDVFDFVAKSSLASTFGILVVQSASKCLMMGNYPEKLSSTFSTVVFTADKLLMLSALNMFFGVLGLSLPRRMGRKLTGIFLFLIALLMPVVVWHVFQ